MILLLGIIALGLVPIPGVLENGNWFWFKECVGLSAFVWFTPALIIFKKSKNGIENIVENEI